MKAINLYENKDVQYVTFSGSYKSALEIHYELSSQDFIDCNLDTGGLNIAYIDESVQG
jgi:acyl-CoA reductase-like NAD-dependent aldehyde dehydrogenase